MPSFPKPIHLAHQFIQNVVRVGDHVVDATLGNGHDALFLAKLVGKKGSVTGFDVQASAVEASERRMMENDISYYRFHLTGHENMREVIQSDQQWLNDSLSEPLLLSSHVSVIMFNLGYLPNADKAVITTEKTTIPAIECGLDLLRVGGLISIMCYPGHVGGDVESEAVSEWAMNLSRKRCRVAKYALHNAPNDPPFLLLVEKLA